MEILPTLALVPGAQGQPETITSGGDDPFLALLAGLMQPSAQPSTPLSIKAGPAGDPAAAAASGQTLTPSSPQPPTLPPSASDQPVATATVAPEVGPIAPATVAIRISAALREPLAAPETAFDPPQEPAVVAKVVPMAPLSPSWMAKAAAPKAEAAAAGGELRPKAVTASHRHQPDRSDEDQVLTDDPGEVPTTVAPVPSSVTPADARTAATAPAHSPGLDPSDLAAPVPEAGAAPVPANESRPPDTPASPPVMLPTPDHRGRPMTASLVMVDGIDGSRVRIDLEPADLGRVEVALRLDDSGTAAASFIVDRPETLQLLQRDARAVNDMLSAAGFTVDQGALDFTLRDPGGRDGGGERQPGAHGRADAELGSGAAPSEPTRPYRSGLLDLQV